nr:immunoglobulin heavy chain junction region [Macaca mulatta]MOX02540.1 immunoglobulin heavy chain junction region [Macaca mulatta]MOX02813.1 immunoglobulin heavy chain junction region [Macaca mulatta]MOX04165.1 immunoglobulin heavy chain junction region [Macaca mulatta]MOX05718.1 immunoglobulin heavy chain junction region [Macaca mulatta]
CASSHGVTFFDLW